MNHVTLTSRVGGHGGKKLHEMKSLSSDGPVYGLASSTTSHECLISLGCGEAGGLGLNVGVFSWAALYIMGGGGGLLPQCLDQKAVYYNYNLIIFIHFFCQWF